MGEKTSIYECEGLGSRGGSRRYCQSGTIHIASEITPSNVEDGTSNTYLIGEKYLGTHLYEGSTSASTSLSINQTAYCGYEWDNQRRTWNSTLDPVTSQELHQPRQDQEGFDSSSIFGSSHPAGFYMSYCDGSVRNVSYDIDPFVHSYSSNRFDGQVLQTQ
jgi:hypothetical protein